ncbi:MAG: hypothetical protein EOP78_02965 [Variovorax sp.]|nr:MAG: hypothetical protein EOP78_02965 [Variovorax sp.]
MTLDAAFSPACPSCRQAMAVRRLQTHTGVTTEIDICFACQGLWFDPQESARLSSAAVIDLFELLHQHRGDAHGPLSASLACPHCKHTLSRSFDLVRSGRYITYRCPQRHGRFATFSSFFIEKGFVRQLTKPEIEELARKVDAIYCTGCGAPVDIRRDHACPHCQAPFSLLDPQAVEAALKRHGQNAAASSPAANGLADKLVAIESNRQLALREEKERREGALDLWAAGVELVCLALAR